MSLPSVDEVWARLLDGVEPLASETTPLGQAVGRVLRAPVVAGRDQPPFAASAMDGWAVRAADLTGDDVSLAIAGESAAGARHDGALKAGQAVRISTGAPLPPGADQIVIQERGRVDGARVTLSGYGEDPAYVRPAGLDFKAGQTLIPAGRRLDGWSLALAAAAGLAEVEVSRAPRLHLVTTGDELVLPGGQPGPDQIFDAAGPGLMARLVSWRLEARRTGPVADDDGALAAAFAALGEDLLVVIGGASVGPHDRVKPVLRQAGLELVFEGVNVRPGRPTWAGRLADGRRVLGLPGNPASALVCADLFLKPLIRALEGQSDPLPRLRPARLHQSLPANGPREHWLRAGLEARDDGLWVAPFEDQDSSRLTVFAEADALLRRPAGQGALSPGALVEVMALARL